MQNMFSAEAWVYAYHLEVVLNLYNNLSSV